MSSFHTLDKLESLRYGMYLPPDHSEAEEPWPILCFLHGRRECGCPSDTREQTEALLTSHGPLKNGTPRGGANDFIVILLQVPCDRCEDPRSFNDNWVNHAGTVIQIVEAVQDNFNGDTERTYLTGFSYGGNGVLDIGSKPRDVWAALWAVDPTRVPETGLKRPVWLSAGPYAARQKTAFEDVFDVREVQNNPSADFVYSFAHPEHPIAAREAYATSEIYRWLLSKRLS